MKGISCHCYLLLFLFVGFSSRYSSCRWLLHFIEYRVPITQCHQSLLFESLFRGLCTIKDLWQKVKLKCVLITHEKLKCFIRITIHSSVVTFITFITELTYHQSHYIFTLILKLPSPSTYTWNQLYLNLSNKSDLVYKYMRLIVMFDFASYLNSFSKFEMSLINFTNDLKSDILACFQEGDTTHTILGRYDGLKFPNYHGYSWVYQCSLLWKYRKIKEGIRYLGSVYCIVYECVLRAIDDSDHHSSIQEALNLPRGSMWYWHMEIQTLCM